MERARGERRALHARTCRVCAYVYSGKAPEAALERSKAREISPAGGAA